MKNKIQIEAQIKSNEKHLKLVNKLLTEKIHDCVSWIGLGETKTIKSLDELKNSYTDSEKLVEIFNLSKSLEVIQANHKAMTRELNEKIAEYDSE
jgi:hypothetical protein